ncbi:FAD-dependent oxidoreductase [Nocardioides tweenelious]|uniref:FAD-dependent oxidoreductase n=1 Tax=Nocardioides tweenelious TaxID=3156607 RepID=UPI003CCD00BE
MTTTVASQTFDVIVVGGGQAGLAVAYHFAHQEADFLVLDAGAEIGESWRTRWDSLRLFTSAQYDGLPGRRSPPQTANTRARTWWPTTCASTPLASRSRSDCAVRPPGSSK